jgi:hypothetical protein
VLGAARAAFRDGSHVEFVEFKRPNGSTGLSRVEVTTNPRRIVVELPADPPSPSHPGEPARRIEVDSPDAYAREYGSDTTHMDPSSPLYRWVLRDVDAYFRARREGAGHGVGSGRTAAGTSVDEPGARSGGATASPGAGPGGSGAAAVPGLREELSARRPDVRARFAEAEAAFAESGEAGPGIGAQFDALMANFEHAGMGEQGRRAIESLLEPGRGQQELSGGRLRRVLDQLRQMAELLAAQPELATSVGLDHYEGGVAALGREVATAYQRGETLDGRRLPDPNRPELAEAMRTMQAAADEYRDTSPTDPIARLEALLRLRDAVARAGETLRVYGPGFTSDVAQGAAKESTLVPGQQEIPLDVRASGDITEPLARDLPGVGLEKYMLRPEELATLPTTPASLGRRLARLLRGYHRAHLVGPGFGSELWEGLMLAPENVNLKVQNKGVEAFIRSAAQAGVDVHLDTQATGRRIEVRLTDGTTERVDILSRVEYTIRGSIGEGDPVTYRVEIDVGPPPAGQVSVKSDIPEGAVGGEVLAAFRKPATPSAGSR